MQNYGIGSFNAFLLAILVYMGLFFFIVFKLNSDTMSMKYTDIKDSFIDVDLGNFTSQNLQKIQDNEEKNTKDDKEDNAQETTNKEVITQEKEQKASDINSLFGNIKDFQEEKTNKVQSSAKSVKNAEKKSASDLFKQLNDNLIPQDTQEKGESTTIQRTGIYDAFLGKVTRTLQERWSLYEVSGNFEIRVTYFIDSNGNFGYTSVSKSYDEVFDTKVMEFLNGLEGKFIAYPPKNQYYQGNLTISDKINSVEEVK